MTLLALPVSVGPSNITINRDDRFIVSKPDGRIESDADEGFFARDTRFVSGYNVWINGHRPVLLNSSPIRFFSARFEFTNPELFDSDGRVERSSIAFRLDRTVFGGVHEDYDLHSYARRPAALTLEVEIDSDFADIFDVKSHQLVRRGSMHSRWYRTAAELRTSYENQDYRRQLIVAVEKAGSHPQFANGRLVFVIELAPKESWHVCLKWLPIVGDGERPSALACQITLLGAMATTARAPKPAISESAASIPSTPTEAHKTPTRSPSTDGCAESRRMPAARASSGTSHSVFGSPSSPM